jgi:hypothetical protein
LAAAALLDRGELTRADVDRITVADGLRGARQS